MPFISALKSAAFCHDLVNLTHEVYAKMIELIIAVGCAIVISAGCSLFEAVLYSVPMRHVETMVQKNKASGRILKELRGNVDEPITAILSLNTIANTAGAAVAGSAATASPLSCS